MYITKQPHKCLKCGHETDYSPHDEHHAPVTESFTGCPKCWQEFLKANIGELKCTVDWSVDGISDYDRAMPDKEAEE